MRRLLKWIVLIFVLVIIMMLSRFVLFIGYVPTESMEPTMPKGSYILGCRIFRGVECGGYRCL